MPQYALYDRTALSPAPVTGWYDTDALSYPNLPNLSNLLQVTPTQWAERLSNTSGWAVSEGILVAYMPPTPPPTLQQQAATILAAGATVTSTSGIVPTLIWPIDPQTQQKMLAVATVLNTLTTFPGGVTTWPVRDMTGAVHSLTVAQFRAVQGACAQVAAQCDLVLDDLSTTLPTPSVSIA